MKIILDSISINEALRYMGHRGDVSDALRSLLCDCEKRLLEAIRPLWTFRVFDVEAADEGVHILNTALTLTGKDIRAHLEGCRRAVLMCATLGGDTDRLIRTMEVSDISSAFAMDAMASAAIEDVCRLCDEEIKKQLPECFLTWRFSPGYGDLPLDLQGVFLDTLCAQKQIGLCCESNNILIPRKSVTAVMGVSDKPLPQKRQGCACCNMQEHCEYRKRGDHCGF